MPGGTEGTDQEPQCEEKGQGAEEGQGAGSCVIVQSQDEKNHAQDEKDKGQNQADGEGSQVRRRVKVIIGFVRIQPGSGESLWICGLSFRIS